MSRLKSIFLYFKFYVSLLSLKTVYLSPCFSILVMDSQDILPKLQSFLTFDLNDFRPLHGRGHLRKMQLLPIICWGPLFSPHMSQVFLQILKKN